MLKEFHELCKWTRNSAYSYKEKMFKVETQIMGWMTK